MVTLKLFFYVLALVCFLLSGCNVGHPRVNLQSLGLAALTAAFMV